MKKLLLCTACAMTAMAGAALNGRDTVYQQLAMPPALSIADNMFIGRELGLATIQNINQSAEFLSGGQRQGVAVARAAAFGSKVMILDDPPDTSGVRNSRKVLELIQDVRALGIPIIQISHNIPHVFEVTDSIHVHRLARRLSVIDPNDHSMSDAVAFMTDAAEPEMAA